MSVRGLLATIGWSLVLLCFTGPIHAQETPEAVPDTTVSDSVVTDSTVADTTVTDTSTAGPRGVDSTNVRPAQAPPDTAEGPRAQRPSQAQRPPAGPGQQSGPPGPGGGQNSSSEAVTFSARDSLVIRTNESGENFGTLHGNASMSYQEATLKARTIDMNFQTSTLRAEGGPSGSEQQSSRPIFQRGEGSTTGGGPGDGGPGGGGPGSGASQQAGDSFTGDVLSYNLSTKRGRVVAARTQQRDGYVEGGAVKMYEDSTLFVEDGTYTTCNCPPGETPSYSLRSSEMKLADRWVYTGPIQLYLFNVPTPLWLPFGFLPNVEGRRSGPLPPQYGEDRRGFFLKDWGWYFALNQYTDLTLRAGIWSQGSYEIRPRFRYVKRYKYNGDFQLTYRRERRGEKIDPGFTNRHRGQLRWNHSQNLSPTASLNGDVNLATSSDFARRNSDNYNDAVRQDVSSSINYRKRWPNGGRQVSISASQNQQFQSGAVNMTLPSLSFSQNSFKPFRREQRIGEQSWYERITTSYQVDVRNRYNFQPRDPADLRQNRTPADSALADSIERANIAWYDALVDRQQYELATGDDKLYDFEATHRVPLNMSFRVDRYNLSLSPNISYTSDWYINTVRRTAQRDSTGGVGDIVERTEPGFYARHDFTSSFSSSTELYGTFPIGVGQFQGLRHRLSPSLSMNYQPNFNAPAWGRTRALRFEDGTPVIADSSTGQVARYDIVRGNRVNRSTEQWRLDFSLSNVFETKKIETDTTGERTEERIQLLNLDVSGLSYNFAADSFRVGQNIGVNARTQISRVDISMRSSFSPYALRPYTIGDERRYRRIDRLMVAESPLTPVRLTSFTVSMGANLSSGDLGLTESGGVRGRGGRTRGRSGRYNRGRRSNRRGRFSNQRRTGRGSTRQTEEQQQEQSEPETASQLTEFSLPWTLNMDFNYGLDKQRKEVTNRNATLNASFSLNITPLWRVRANTGYDFLQKELSTTSININRNLGCWNMSFTWVPFGEYQKYGFNLQVSSGQLSQLLQLQIPNKGGEGRLGGYGERLRGTVQGAAGVQTRGGGAF